MKKRILITGANGFIGYHLISAAISEGWEVHAGVRNGCSTGHLTGPDMKIVELDYESKDQLEEVLRTGKYEYIVHAAAATRARDQAEYDHINAGYTKNILNAVRTSGIDIERFVLISSLAAIGPVSYDEKKTISEMTDQNPVTQYGRSKQRAEEYCRSFQDIPWVIIRPTAVYGEREGPPDTDQDHSKRYRTLHWPPAPDTEFCIW